MTKQSDQERPKTESIANMSNLVKIIKMRQLEADLLAKSLLSDCMEWANDTSSDLPELEGETERAVLEGLSVGTGDPQETTPGPSTVPTQTTEVRVERMKLTHQQQTTIGGGVVGASWQRKSCAKTRKQRNRQSRLAGRVKPQKATVDPMSLMESWMPDRAESTQAYLTRLEEN